MKKAIETGACLLIGAIIAALMIAYDIEHTRPNPPTGVTAVAH